MVNYRKVSEATRMLLEAIGEDPEREGLRDTPNRVARAWTEFIDYEPGSIDTVFQSIKVDQMVVIRDMSVFSFCEHHLLPFNSLISVGYIAGDRVLGLSKIARVCHKHAHKLQLQERLIEGIAVELKNILEHENVAVVGSGHHSCMYMRGIKTDGLVFSSSMNGVFLSEASARSEFLQFAGVN